MAGKAEKPNPEAGLGNDCQQGAVPRNAKAAAGLGSNSEERAMQRQQQAGVRLLADGVMCFVAIKQTYGLRKCKSPLGSFLSIPAACKQ